MSHRTPSDCLLRSWMLRDIHEQKLESTKSGPDHGPDHRPDNGPDRGPDVGLDHRRKKF